MENNILLLDEEQYRLLMCHRMAASLGKGDIFPEVTPGGLCWRMEKDGQVTGIFYGMEEMESYLEHLLEERYRTNPGRLGNTDPKVKRRMEAILERYRARTKGCPMTFQSKVNGYYEKEKML